METRFDDMRRVITLPRRTFWITLAISIVAFVLVSGVGQVPAFILEDESTWSGSWMIPSWLRGHASLWWIIFIPYAAMSAHQFFAYFVMKRNRGAVLIQTSLYAGLGLLVGSTLVLMIAPSIGWQQEKLAGILADMVICVSFFGQFWAWIKRDRSICFASSVSAIFAFTTAITWLKLPHPFEFNGHSLVAFLGSAILSFVTIRICQTLTMIWERLRRSSSWSWKLIFP